ncbi:hypothetical protein TALC_00397 [Thermoplasmatales archaeon BRNA1]|nr:hypothetical protein TALC_00397 [Thermoplasmatales archaeon BRNA1]
MQIRVTGTESECAEFADIIRTNVPHSYIRSISKFYPNRSKGGSFSTEGRIYIDFRDCPGKYLLPGGGF